MKAPDKIYVTIDRPAEKVLYNPELVGVAWSKKDKSCEHIEFIRKDALLEWAKERYQQTISNVGYYTGHSVWQEVIEKLESL